MSSDPRRWVLTVYPGEEREGFRHVVYGIQPGATDETAVPAPEGFENVSVVSERWHEEQLARAVEEAKRERTDEIVEWIRPSPTGGTPIDGEDFDRLNRLASLADRIEELFGVASLDQAANGEDADG